MFRTRLDFGFNCDAFYDLDNYEWDEEEQDYVYNDPRTPEQKAQQKRDNRTRMERFIEWVRSLYDHVEIVGNVDYESDGGDISFIVSSDEFVPMIAFKQRHWGNYPNSPERDDFPPLRYIYQ